MSKTLALIFIIISFRAIATEEGDVCTPNTKLTLNFLCREGFALDCQNADGKNDLALCASKDFAIADHELNIIYQKVLRSLDKPNDNNADYKEARKNLMLAQRLWIKFRDVECAIHTSLNLYGSLQAAEEEGCRAEMTKDRAKEIQKWYEQ